ncbi:MULTISPECIES: hypothetical protein [unclassified Pedobacter]|uniref:hypothetical protein n=1 Tax=unclassified Pedobacter TaxID=2628915 RepID=UPI00141F273C|nr:MULTISPECIES: hypothetical protein [unclassified Pedobacter]NII81761.1 hypothetical protein [Pedobacter sp. SG908]NMN35763.1 hypothetical protein [Pedobacter sp. SG918]
MKKILIIPVFLVCLTGASSRRVDPVKPSTNKINAVPINKKVDSLDIKLQELESLLRKS